MPTLKKHIAENVAKVHTMESFARALIERVLYAAQQAGEEATKVELSARILVDLASPKVDVPEGRAVPTCFRMCFDVDPEQPVGASVCYTLCIGEYPEEGAGFGPRPRPTGC
jgi:hypothetical protein